MRRATTFQVMAEMLDLLGQILLGGQRGLAGPVCLLVGPRTIISPTIRGYGYRASPNRHLLRRVAQPGKQGSVILSVTG